MAKLFVHHKVEDYPRWRQIYDSADSVRRQYGMTGDQVFHTAANPNEIVIIITWGNADQARAYGQSSEIKQAMKDGGVISQPEVLILEELE